MMAKDTMVDFIAALMPAAVFKSQQDSCRQGQIIAIAAFVTNFKVIAANRHNAAIS
jgi:hypothetical protein